MPKETMTPRERWLAVLRRQKPDRVPMDYWATSEVTERLQKHLGCETEEALFERLHIDKAYLVVPEYIGPESPEGRDLFGCGFENKDYGTGVYAECTFHPLAECETVGDIERIYTWPSPDWFDFSGYEEQLRRLERHPVRPAAYEPFALYQRLRGPEQAYMDLMLNPEMVHHCLDRIFDYYYELFTRIYERSHGQITMTYIAEDLGTQEDLMYSPAQIHEFFIPRMKKMMDLAHQAGSFVFNHDDGAVRKIIPDMIEAGMDIQNPVQWRCKGMDREALRRDFGDRIIFHGAVDNQYTLAFGTADEVRREVLDNLRIFEGCYILAPCHNIQPISPTENILAMYQTGYEYGWK